MTKKARKHTNKSSFETRAKVVDTTTSVKDSAPKQPTNEKPKQQAVEQPKKKKQSSSSEKTKETKQSKVEVAAVEIEVQKPAEPKEKSKPAPKTKKSIKSELGMIAAMLAVVIALPVLVAATQEVDFGKMASELIGQVGGNTNDDSVVDSSDDGAEDPDAVPISDDDTNTGAEIPVSDEQTGDEGDEGTNNPEVVVPDEPSSGGSDDTDEPAQSDETDTSQPPVSGELDPSAGSGSNPDPGSGEQSGTEGSTSGDVDGQGEGGNENTAPPEEPALPTSHITAGVDALMQKPELEYGCESVALTIVLRYMGYDISKTEIYDRFLPKSTNDFVNAYLVGAYKGSDYNMCFAPAIEKAAKDFLVSKSSTAQVSNISGCGINDLYALVAADYPVVVWFVSDTSTPRFYGSAISGIKGYSNEHAVVLYGYDKEQNKVYLSDPLKGLITWDMSSFENLFVRCQSNAVSITGYHANTPAGA
ncbi:MAG: C39 family peptidase [Eggerthellaceae bacterium]|nr:C39 family peptidase [Eggerthellaceae bacterium]